MEARHTPDKWELMGFVEGNLFIATEKGTSIAYVEHPIYDNEKLTKAQAKANAQLIVAAPDLLEACQEALDWIEKTVQLWDGLAMPDCAGTLEQAIAKAAQQPWHDQK